MKKKKKTSMGENQNGSDPVSIRDVTPEDAKAIADIYAYYVKNTAISFETEAPDKEEMKRRIENITKVYPFVVAVVRGVIVGYAYASCFKDRAAYFCSVETSVYVKKGYTRKGIGSLLYDELEFQLKERAFVNAYACIAYPIAEDKYLDKNSVEFHKAMGYTICGIFENCAVKFDNWYSMVWMAKKL